MISGEAMRCRKVERILRYRMPNKLLSPEKVANHVVLLFPQLEKNCYRVFHQYIKINYKRKESRMLLT